MKSNLLFKNSYYSVLQTITLAIAALLLFKLAVMQLGLEVTGLWSYLSSITTITSFGNFGFANALLYYIPRYCINHDEQHLNKLINTTFLSVLGLTTLLCIIAFAVFYFIIPVTVTKSLAPLALKMLPLIIVSFLFAGLSAGYLTVLDGLILMHVRSKINIAGSIIFLVIGFILILKIGIIGIPLAQLVQNIFLLITAYLVVKKNIPSYKFSWAFSKPIFKNIFKYGFSFQLISITQIVSEPFMKSIITKFSGTEITAIFDFCVKLLSVFRSLLISANQTIVPQLTIFKAKQQHLRLNIYYKANLKLIILASLLFFLSSIVFKDSLSLFFLNTKSSDFNFIIINVSLGLLFNALALPAHFYYLGTGNVKWNVINNVMIAIIILITAPLIGTFIGGKYVVISWSASAIIGSFFLLIIFYRKNNISILPFFNKNIVQIVVAFLLAILINKYLNELPAIKDSHLAIVSTNAVVLILLLVYPLYKNITLNKIKEWIKAKYFK